MVLRNTHASIRRKLDSFHRSVVEEFFLQYVFRSWSEFLAHYRECWRLRYVNFERPLKLNSPDLFAWTPLHDREDCPCLAMIGVARTEHVDRVERNPVTGLLENFGGNCYLQATLTGAALVTLYLLVRFRIYVGTYDGSLFL